MSNNISQKSGIRLLYSILFMLLFNLNKLYAYDITPSYNNLRFAADFIDDTISVIVYDKNQNYLGRYVNIEAVSSNQKLKNTILWKGVEASVFELKERANNNFNAINFSHNEVDDVIKKMNVVKNILDVASQYTKKGVETSEAIVNAWIDEINLAYCNEHQKNNFCKSINSATFTYIKDILIEIAKDRLKYFHIKPGTQLSIPFNITKMEVLQHKFSLVLKGAGNALWLGDVLNNIISSIVIKKKVIRLQEASLMIQDFYRAYVYGFNQDINKLKTWLLKEAEKQRYRLPGNFKLTDKKLVSFAHIFFHYIMLRKTTAAGNYNFITKRYYTNSSQTSVKNVDMHSMPLAANIMMDRIQKFGNGGNLSLNISEDFQKFYLNKMNPLYVLPKDNDGKTLCTIYNNYSEVYFNDCEFSKITGSCKIEDQKIGKLAKYNVYKDMGNKKYVLSEISATISCSYTLDFPLVDENMNEKIKIDNLFIKKNIFSDIQPDFWALEKIERLYKGHIINGYADGEFKPKEDITIGQFLKMITNAIYLNTDKTKLKASSKTNSIDFSNYANFLVDDKKIDIGFTKNEYKTKLSNKADRKYIASILAGILADKGFTKKISCTKTDGDWDKCSDFLNSKCIALGNSGKYLPNTNITRDEVSVMIVRTMDVVSKAKLTCTDRFGKEIK